MRANGAIEGAAAGFSVNDEVIVLKKRDDTIIKVIGHTDGIRQCGWPYIIHNFETLTEDYIWPDADLDSLDILKNGSSLTTDCKFGTNALLLKEYEIRYPDDDTEFDAPFTIEYWLKVDGTFNLSVNVFWHLLLMNSMDVGAIQFTVYNNPGAQGLKLVRWIRDLDGNEVLDDEPALSLTTGEFIHFAVTVTANKVFYFLGGFKQGEFESSSPTGFKGRPGTGFIDTWWLATLYNNYGKSNGQSFDAIIDAFCFSHYAKYTHDFTPPTTPPAAPA